MSTVTIAPTAIETLAAAHEAAADDLNHATEDLARAERSFTTRKTVCASAEYASLRMEYERAIDILEDARARHAAAEAALATVRFEQNQKRAEAARQQRLEAIDGELQSKSAQIKALQSELAAIPERLARAAAEHSQLLAERARLLA